MKRNKLIFNSTIAFILLITVILCEEWSKKKSEMIDQTSFFFDYGTDTSGTGGAVGKRYFVYNDDRE